MRPHLQRLTGPRTSDSIKGVNTNQTLAYGLSCLSFLSLAACSGSGLPNPTPMPTATLTPAPSPVPTEVPLAPLDYECNFVEEGFGPVGSVRIGVQVLAEGLAVPWGIGFLPDGSWLITERAGDVRRRTPAGELQDEPVLTIAAAPAGEGGLLGIAIHPEFVTNRLFYLYFTGEEGGTLDNRIERYVLSEDAATAAHDRTILTGMPANTFHDGGRLRFGPDGFLYASLGDAGTPSRAQDPDSPAGKILRIDPDGNIPADNPFPNSPAWVIGVRNSQGFDWREDGRMVLVDHGPSFEFGLRGRDEVNITEKGANLGWPEITACETADGLQAPVRSWREAMPPGGLAIYRGSEIPQWKDDLLIGVLSFGSTGGHLHRIRLDTAGQVLLSEVYLRGEYGRLRDVIMGPDGGLYVTTSNCDGRNTCPPEGDLILRIGAAPD